jgi:signal transduction histidine kinase
MNQGSASRGKRRYRNIVFFVFGLLVILRLAHFYVSDSSEKQWGTLVDEKSQQLLDDASSRFASLQREIRRIATDLARRTEITSYLDHSQTDPGPIFREVFDASTKHDVGVEVYDDMGHLVAWSGIGGPQKPSDISLALQGTLTSYVIPSALYSQLQVTTPVRIGDTIAGAVVVRHMIDIHYPLNKRYIDRESFSDAVDRDLGATFRFDFTPGGSVPKDTAFAREEVFGIDSATIATVSVLRPSLQSYLERIDAGFRAAEGLLITLLLVFVVTLFWQRIRLFSGTALKCVLATVLIWAARYALLWAEIPSMYFEGGVFAPAYYASTFGGGIAKSIGELTLTSLALIINTLVVLRFVALAQDSLWRPRHRTISVVLVLALSAILFLLLRGYSAVVRSAVFDSSLMFADATVVIPSFEQALMLVNLFTISLSLVLAATAMVSYMSSLVAPASPQGKRGWVHWLLVGGILVLVSALFGIVQEHPLTSEWYRLIFIGGILAYAIHIWMGTRSLGTALTPGLFLAPLGLSALFLYPQLDARTQEKDRQRIEVFASDFLRPVDNWLTFVVDESLQLFLSDGVRSTLQHGTPEEMQRLALSVWSQSIVCREGYSCLFLLADSLGRELSAFSIGNQSLLADHRRLLSGFPARKSIRIQQTGKGVSEFKVYRGSVPLTLDTLVLGYAHVLVAAGQQTLFRGDIPTFLRSPSPESIESFYRTVTVAEFRDGVLFASNADIFPVKALLPEPARTVFDKDAPRSFWTRMTVSDDLFDVLVVRGSREEGQVVLLLLPSQGLPWQIFNAVKMLFWYSLLVLLILGVYLLFRWARGNPYRPTFRDKLLGALLLTAVIPLVVIAYYGKDFAEHSLMKDTAERLERETEAVALQILEDIEAGFSQWSPADVEEIAGQLGTDYNFYVDNRLESTSRPELYDAGLLNRRIDGRAYLAVVIEGQRFFQQTENVGSYRYAVGYRSVIDSEGNSRGVVSVPTIYRQDELDQQIARQNAFLFGVYAVVFLAILVVATTVSGRIASPIHRLTEATRRVSQGELDVTLTGERADGEIGELVRSFEVMTQDLKRQREDLVKYERELAWKEMAKQVAHEIKNPLTPMKLSLQHLRQTYRDRVPDFDRVLEEVVASVVEQIDALSRIASEFSRFARMPNASLRECNVNEVLQEALRLFLQQQGVEFRQQFEAKDPVVLADREELRRAFINIIRNGMQAMGNRGRMHVSTLDRGNDIEIMIRDFGVGIPEEIKGKLFQPNFSTKTEGMGLGLAIVKRTIDDMKGSIRIEPADGKGTVVTILLPRATRDVTGTA